MPRWLTPAFAARLEEMDREFWTTRRNGPLVIEVHYRGGQPQMARLRDVLLAPVLLEVSLSVCTTS